MFVPENARLGSSSTCEPLGKIKPPSRFDPEKHPSPSWLTDVFVSRPVRCRLGQLANAQLPTEAICWFCPKPVSARF